MTKVAEIIISNATAENLNGQIKYATNQNPELGDISSFFENLLVSTGDENNKKWYLIVKK